MNQIATEMEAEGLIGPHLGTIKLIMRESLQELNAAMGQISVTTNNRSKTSLLHSIAVEKAGIYFRDTPGIYLVKKYQSLQIVFNDRLVARIKKVNEENLCRNAKSSRNDAILSHQPTLFPDLPALTFIDLGYRINSIWTEYERLVVVCRLRNSVLWYIDFTETEEAIAPMVHTPAADIDITAESQIKLKKAE